MESSSQQAASHPRRQPRLWAQVCEAYVKRPPAVRYLPARQAQRSAAALATQLNVIALPAASLPLSPQLLTTPAGATDAIAFGRSFISTPDLVQRLRVGADWNK